MSTAETRTDLNPIAARTGSEPLAERMLAYTALGGAFAGAVAGTVAGKFLEPATHTDLSAVCGTLGTMLGSALAACGWCLLVRVWATLFTENETNCKRGAGDLFSAIPTSSAR